MTRKNVRPPTLRQKANLRFWKNLLRGEPAFLIGNGCSVQDEDVKQVADYFTIGINRAFYLFDPVVLFWQDVSLWETEKQHVLASTAVKVCRDIADPMQRFINYRLRTTDGPRLPDTPNILYGPSPSGPVSYQLAYALGCDPIVAVGFDCKYRNDKTDFYGVNPHHSDRTLASCTRGLHWIAKASTERRLINCSDNDILGPRIKLAHLLPTLGKPKGREHYIRVLEAAPTH